MTLTIRERDREERLWARALQVREPLTYSRFSSHSWFVDCWRGQRLGDSDAATRIEHHGREMRVELREIERRSSSATAPEGTRLTYESRVVDLEPGAGGYSVPPLWLVEDEGVAPRPGRVLAGLVPNYRLPNGVQSVSVPRITTGVGAAETPPSSAIIDIDLQDTATGSPVVTIAGDADVALAMIEQSPGGAFDQVLYRDLLSSYDQQLETALITGNGSGTAATQTIQGLMNVSGGSIAFTSGSPTATALFSSLGLAFSYVANHRFARAEVWLCRGGRWAWIATSEDQSNRPIEVPSAAYSYVTNPATPTPIGGLVSLPAFTTEAISTTLGSAGNQDTIIACRPSDMMLFESAPTVSTFTEVLAGTLGARVQLRRYVAGIVGRYPSGTCSISGSGMAVQAGY
jgi:hypothetical protein